MRLNPETEVRRRTDTLVCRTSVFGLWACRHTGFMVSALPAKLNRGETASDEASKMCNHGIDGRTRKGGTLGYSLSFGNHLSMNAGSSPESKV